MALFWKVRRRLNRRCLESINRYWKCSRYSEVTPRGAYDQSSNSTPRARYATELWTVADLHSVSRNCIEDLLHRSGLTLVCPY